MRYSDEIRKNPIFWEKILGKEICIQLENKNEDIQLEKFSSHMEIVEPYYQEALLSDRNSDKCITEKLVFRNFYSVFLRTAYFYWRTKGTKLLQDAWLSIVQNLYKKIEWIPLRVLIQDIHQAKEQGLLNGKNETEEYEDYEQRFLGKSTYINELCKQYPEMKRLLFLQIYQVVNQLWELESIVKKEKTDLVKRFCNGKSFDRIIKIEMGLSDPHKEGKTVAKVFLDNGYKLIYKPHELKKEELFQEVYAEMLNAAGLDMKKIQIWDQGNYGWEEYIGKETCNTAEEVERYFERIGVLLFLCYAMNASDVHGENLIAAGEYPMLVDLETFPGCGKNRSIAQNADQLVRERLSNSVLYAGLLPVVMWEDKKQGAIVSALHRNEKVLTPFQLPLVSQPYSSAIHIEYQQMEFSLEESLPTYQYNEINPADYTKQICKGFSETYEYVLAHLKETMSKFEDFFLFDSRVLVRHTQQYGMYLRTSFYPEFLQSTLKRRLFLHVLDKMKMHFPLYDYEGDALLQMNLPAFSAEGKSKVLKDGNDGNYAEYLTKSAYETWKDKIDQLSNGDKEQQLRFIRLSLALLADRKHPIVNKRLPVTAMSDQEREEVVRQITDYICSTALLYEKEDVSWSGLRFYDDRRWSIVPLGMYLYDGIAGAAIFLAAAVKKYGQPAYEKVWYAAKKTLFSYTDQILKNERQPETWNSGLFVGEGSVVHAYLLLYQITEEKIFLKYAKRHSMVLAKVMRQEKGTDLLSGLAGAIVVLVKLYQETEEGNYLQTAAMVGEQLWERSQKMETGVGFEPAPEKAPLGGMAHGNSGYILAYAYLLEATGEARYADRIKKLIQYENSLYCQETGNWKDLRREETEGPDMNGWCHGAAGILLARLKLKSLLEFQNDSIIDGDIERCKKALLNYKITDSSCLCHGLAGICWIIKRYLKRYPDADLEEKEQELKKLLVSRWWETKSMLVQERDNVALMMGIAGMGLMLIENEKEWELLC